MVANFPSLLEMTSRNDSWDPCGLGLPLTELPGYSRVLGSLGRISQQTCFSGVVGLA